LFGENLESIGYFIALIIWYTMAEYVTDKEHRVENCYINNVLCSLVGL